MMKWIGLCVSILAVVGLGFALGNCGNGGDKGECARTADCTSQGSNYYCDLNTKTCVCAPGCTGKCCGDDGCGGQCQDNCPTGQVCNDTSCECQDDGGECTNGEVRCNNNNAQTCQSQAWVTTENCTTTGATCVNGACEGGACTNGAYRCNGNVSEICANQAWTQNEDCAAGGEVCNAGTGQCEPAAGCTNGQTRCNGTIVQTCTNNAWADGTDCATTGKVCSAGACVDQGTTHPGAGDACLCDPNAADCATPCPSDAGSANVCITTDAQGNGFCSFECAISGDCAADFQDGCCEDVGGSNACLPFDFCPGTNTEGQACEFDLNDDGLIVNDGAGNCVDGLTCLGIDADPTNDPCGAVADCGMQDNWNPQCVGGGCGASFCAAACDVNGGCPDGFSPVTTGDGSCFCAPAAPAGDNVQGDLCGAGPGNCVAGLDCVQFQGTTNGYCTAQCDCNDGSGCPAPSECMWTNQAQDTCWCGYQCASGNATDCPDGGQGWTCEDIGSGETFYACVPQ